MLRILALVSAALLTGVACTAGRAEVDRQEPCGSAETQLELNACWAEAARGAESVLAQRYVEADHALEEGEALEAQELLHAAQLGWESYRDLQCRAARSLYEGGSMASMVESVCRHRLARERTREIEVVYME